MSGFRIGVSEKRVCRELGYFAFHADKYRILKGGFGFCDLHLANISRENNETSMRLAIRSGNRSVKERRFFPSEIACLFGGYFIQCGAGLEIITDDLGVKSKSGYPVNIRSLFSTALRRYHLNGQSISVVIHHPLWEIMLEQRRVIHVDHVALFVGERCRSESLRGTLPRYAAQIVYSNFGIRDVFQSLSPAGISSLACDLILRGMIPERLKSLIKV